MRIIDKTLSDKVAKTTTEYAERAVEQNAWSETGEYRGSYRTSMYLFLQFTFATGFSLQKSGFFEF